MADAIPPLISMADQFTGLPMGALIGGPLKAAAEANAMMAVTQTKFILDTGFYKTEGSPSYQPIMIDMKLTRGVLVPVNSDDGTPQEPVIEQVVTTFQVPLITILPLNSLGVDDVTIKFDMEVKSSFAEATSEKTKEEFSGASSFSAKIGYGCFSAEIKGSASYNKENSTSIDRHYEKSNMAKYSVSVHAGQLPLPDGVKIIINAFASSISPVDMPKDKR